MADQQEEQEEDREEEQDQVDNDKPGSDEKKVTASKRSSPFKVFTDGIRLSSASRAESILLLSAWLVYFVYSVTAYGKGATWS